MKLDYPYSKPFTFNQGFNQNANTYYAEGGMTGHSGIDMGQRHQAPIYASCDAYCYLVTPQTDPMKYSAVYTLVDLPDEGIAYEVSYGHCDTIQAQIGPIKRGEQIATQGNKGNVARGGMKITKEMKLAGSTAGTHLHFQVRLLKRSTEKEAGKKYMYHKKINGFYYEIPYYNNGTKGCIDPTPFWTGKYPKETPFVRTLRYGDKGEDVKELQGKLKIKADGIFGVQTDKAVRDFQKKNKLKVDGVVGPITRLKLRL